MDWLRRRKDDNRTLDQYIKHQVPDAECRIYAPCQKDFVLWRNLLYLKIMPKRRNEDVLVFIVPGLKQQAVIDGCHQYLGHRGRNRTLSLLRERFWWLGMVQRMMLSVCNCEKCHIFEAKPQIPPMEPILCTEPLDLVHIDYMSMEVTVGVKEKLVIKNVWSSRTISHAILKPMSPTTTPCTLRHAFCTTSFSRCSGFLDK